MSLRHPALAAFMLAPVLGEWLSAASSPIDLLYPPSFIMLVALYGGGAVLCREIGRRCGAGLRGLCLLAAAYAVFEEALVDRFWFVARPSSEGGLGNYSEVWHTNVLLATNLTIFHVTVSIVSTGVLTELVFPEHRQLPWIGGRGLLLTAVSFLVLPPLIFGDYSLDPAPQLAAAAVLMLVLAAAGSRLRGRPSLWTSTAAARPRRRGVAAVAFLAAAANFLLMGLSDTDIAWPVALCCVISPVVAAFLILRNRTSGPVFGRDGLRVVSGVLSYYCVFATGVAVTGRYDLVLGPLIVITLLWWVRRSTRRADAITGATRSGT